MKINLSRFCKRRRTYLSIDHYWRSKCSVKALKIWSVQSREAFPALAKATVVLLIILFQITSTVYAQNITLKKNHASLESILKSIESQSKYVFFYKKAELSTITNVSVDLKSIPLDQALKGILKGYDLEYQIFDKTIGIKKKSHNTDANNRVDTMQKKALTVLKGKVVDENQLPIKGVTIKETQLNKATSSDDNGEFKIARGKSGSIIISALGFAKKTIYYSDTTYLDIMMEKGDKKTIDLSEVKIQSNEVKENPTKFVNLENRSYMNLSQVLQGTIPGLSLQVVNSTSKTITSIDAYVHIYNGVPTLGDIRFTVDDFLNYFGKAKGQGIIDILLKGTNVPKSISDFYKLNTVTTVTNTLVPEIRGASNFGSNTSGMLVVIDGFPQDGFPANYPMTNVESIEVIKDPKELIKWGAKAAGGAILIKSKPAKKGKLEFNYSANFYYSPAPKFNREKLKIANSATYLNYLRDVDSTLGNTYGTTFFNLSPAKQLLNQKKLKLITSAQFDTKWDSLSRLDNESQLNLLQQSSFNQTQNLTVSGGNKAYKFTAIGNYTGGQTNNLGGDNKTYSFSLNNNFSLLKDKLHIRWLINYSDTKSKAGYSFSATNIGIDPYQMLLDNQGNYVYDYTALTASGNQNIVSRGYKDFGVNILQDARVNYNSSLLTTKQSNFTMKWNLLPSLTWATSVYYTGRKTGYDNFYGAESSYVRQLVDTYGQVTPSGVNFYLPYGNIFKSNLSTDNSWNARSSLAYTQIFGKHVITLGIGGGAYSRTKTSPAYGTSYGYNSTTKTSTPVYLPIGVNYITNFYQYFTGSTSTVYPFTLAQKTIGDTSVARNLNGNVSLDYQFSDRIKASGLYNAIFNPLYGQSETYSVLSTYKSDITGRVVKNWGKFLKDVLVSVGYEGLKMPNLPSQYSNSRYLQSYWGDYTIWVNGATPTQQQGQSSNLFYQKLTVAIADSALVLNGAYNTQVVHGNLVSLTTSGVADKTVTTTKYLSAGMDMFLRKKLLNLHLDYSKSPEGQTQYNGSFNYNIIRESYFKSKIISDLEFNVILQEISPYQGLGLMTSTNVASNGSYSQATNGDYTLLPAKNQNFEVHGKMGLRDNKYNIDLRYYDHTSSGLDNNLSILTDPSTGLSNQLSYSSITNRGVEFFFDVNLIKTKNFNYNITLNGARNSSIAKNVPLTYFTATSDYTTTLREGYDISNIWAPKWAGLNSSGDPQIYDKNGKVTSVLDSATIAGAMVKQGVTKAPWTGGLIQEVRFHQFFTRVALTFNLGYVMRYYLPYPGSDTETSSLVANRWRKAGDEKTTDIPKISASGSNSFREFVTRFSSNSILPADNIRLQEVMVGFNLPDAFIKKYGLSYFVMTFQVQNLAYWARNKYNIDPATIGTNGRITNPLPKIYSCNLSVNF